MGDSFQDFTLAAVQAAPVYLDRDASIEKACGLIEQAGAKGADLAVFGETWVSGYASFAAWANHPAFGGLLRKFVLNGVEIPSPATDALCRAARQAGCDVAIGVAERDGTTGGSIYATLLFIGREGVILGKHRKLKPTMYERTVWGEGDGSSLRLYDRPYGKLGGLNCWEHQMVLPGYALISQGLQVHAGVWPGGTFTRQEVLSRAFAMQSAAYVVMVGGLLRESDIPADIRDLAMTIDGRVRHLVTPCDGDSAIIGPDGEFLAGPLLNEEGILTAKGNTGTVMFQKMIADHAGHYTRPDVFEFRVNRTSKRIAEFRETAGDVRLVHKAIGEGAISSRGDLLGALDDLNIDLERLPRESA
ncbi:carbon-nitrogen hydrolase family protein [Candidatus Amarobacter glycogenicus]|uniref:carbon-nitrogen hydrolase family protein n=1 Tax=Candidatus Amarobacter glycogenicus TaxID=3140699 RepID=UPI003136CA8A|nr:carbon-nitrogen hydrolase family protein [Dehalococcoidia bacterium]MBK8559016.1 carbon-nitrogen hydrolase family protein [Dehalococcoidia bacterium]